MPPRKTKNIAGTTALKYFGTANIRSVRDLKEVLIRKYKITVFLPAKNADEITKRMAAKGAGVIGNYKFCSFRVSGKGTFRGGRGSNPAVGKRGKLEIADEVRVEMICAKKYADAVLDEVYRIHPYEEPACDVYEVLVREEKTAAEIKEVILKKSISPADIIVKINRHISKDQIPFAISKAKIRRFVMNNSGVSDIVYPFSKLKTIYIHKSEKEIKIEII